MRGRTAEREKGRKIRGRGRDRRMSQTEISNRERKGGRKKRKERKKGDGRDEE